MLLIAAAMSLAIVTQEPAALRAAPRDSAQQQAQLWPGDSLEVRGEKGDFLQVWDYRRERGGYIRVNQVRSMTLTAADAPQMLAVVQFVRDTPRAESLGIGYAAAFLKAAPAEMIGPEVFDAIGTMADRLARRASADRGKTGDVQTAAQLEVLASYGVNMTSFERDGRMQICYEGDAFRRVMAMPNSSSLLRARAALSLTRHECVNPDLTPTERADLDKWRVDILSRVDTSTLPTHVKNRILMRRAGIYAGIAYQQQRRGESATEVADHAVNTFAAINKSELTEDDAFAYSDAAARTGVTRWAASDAMRAVSTLHVTTHAGEPGQTCIQLLEDKLAEDKLEKDKPTPDKPAANKTEKTKALLFERCTWGIVYPASAAPNPQHTALALAVQTLDCWRELWLFRKGEQGWYVEVIPPSANGPDIGYIDFAGWVPGGKQMLTAREVRIDGRYKRSYEVLNLDSLQVDLWADKPESLTPFYRWQDPGWKRMALR